MLEHRVKKGDMMKKRNDRDIDVIRVFRTGDGESDYYRILSRFRGIFGNDVDLCKVCFDNFIYNIVDRLSDYFATRGDISSGELCVIMKYTDAMEKLIMRMEEDIANECKENANESK